MVLAAGLGTRLRPLTNALPKPLLPFGDRPLIEHAFRVVRQAGLGPSVVVNTHYLAEAFERKLPEFSLDVRLSHEVELLGTAGGIARARPLLEPPVLVMTSDVVLEDIPPGLRERAAEGGMVLAVAPRPRGEGTVGIGEDGRVVRLRGIHFGEETAGGDYVGLMALGQRALAAMPAQGCYIEDYVLPELSRGTPIQTHPYTSGFIVAGDDVASFFAENLRWLQRERGGESFVGPGADVAVEVVLHGSIVGAGATVEGCGPVRRSVIFPGVRCAAPLADALIAPGLDTSRNG